jgi:hypothetical protein
MPYVKDSHRKKLDPQLEVVSGELAQAASALAKPQAIGELYFSRFFEISSLVKDLAANGGQQKSFVSSSSPSLKSSQELAKLIYEIGTEDGSFWAGDLNYSITRIIQIVPKKLVQRHLWEKEFRYWTYTVTAGSLERTALEFRNHSSSNKKGDTWLDVVLVGVLTDIKDEYKRRVNVPYEIEQQRINGDCYDVKL